MIILGFNLMIWLSFFLAFQFNADIIMCFIIIIYMVLFYLNISVMFKDYLYTRVRKIYSRFIYLNNLKIFTSLKYIIVQFKYNDFLNKKILNLVKFNLFLNNKVYLNNYSKWQMNFVVYNRINKILNKKKIDNNNVELEKKGQKIVFIFETKEPLFLNMKTLSNKQKKVIMIKNKISENIWES